MALASKASITTPIFHLSLNSSRSTDKLWLPRYWLIWVGAGFGWLVARLPLRLLRWSGFRLGDLLFAIRPSRARVAKRNIDACFPELNPAERSELLRENLRETGLAFFETLLVWFGNPMRLRKMMRIEGAEHLEPRDGRGVMVLGFHFNNIEMGTLLLAANFPVVGVYRPHDNAAMEYLQTRGRLNNSFKLASGLQAQLHDRADVRGIVRYLRGGRQVWIAADQDLGRKRSLFAPFFGIPAATATVTSKLARMTGCAVVPVTFERLQDGGYLLRAEPPLDDFPGDSEQADCVRYNQLVETLVRRRPHAYMWVHKRFKTRPPGQPPFYS